MLSKMSQKQIKLYNQGFSMSEVAKLTNDTKNRVKAKFFYYNSKNLLITNKPLGKDTEEKVAQWFEDKDWYVERQKGDAPFDLLINKQRFDVKSAHKTFSDRHSPCYKFQLQDKTERKLDKNFEASLDWFLFVFLDEDGWPMYRLRPTDINIKYTLSITDIKNSKYPLQFLGYLERGESL